jgi:hypothetical protein
MRSFLRRLRGKKGPEPAPPTKEKPARGKEPSRGSRARPEPPAPARRRRAAPPPSDRSPPEPPAEEPAFEGSTEVREPSVPPVPGVPAAFEPVAPAPPEEPDDAVAAMADRCFVCGTPLNGSYCPTCRMTWVE